MVPGSPAEEEVAVALPRIVQVMVGRLVWWWDKMHIAHDKQKCKKLRRRKKNNVPALVQVHTVHNEESSPALAQVQQVLGQQGWGWRRLRSQGHQLS